MTPEARFLARLAEQLRGIAEDLKEANDRAEIRELAPRELEQVGTHSYRPVDRVCRCCGEKHLGNFDVCSRCERIA